MMLQTPALSSAQELATARAGQGLQDGLETFTGTECLATPLGQEISSSLGATGPDTQQTNGASCPSKALGSIPPPCDLLGPSPWICTLHQRLACCPAAGGSQSLQLENRECVLEGGPRAPPSQSRLGKLFLILPPALGYEDSKER